MIQRVETYENGVLVYVENVEVQDPPPNNDVLNLVASMTPEQIEELKSLLGIQ
jgi:hypothetical protein